MVAVVAYIFISIKIIYLSDDVTHLLKSQSDIDNLVSWLIQAEIIGRILDHSGGHTTSAPEMIGELLDSFEMFETVGVQADRNLFLEALVTSISMDR